MRRTHDAWLRRRGRLRSKKRRWRSVVDLFRHAVVQMVPYDPDDPKYESPDQTGWWREYC